MTLEFAEGLSQPGHTWPDEDLLWRHSELGLIITVVIIRNSRDVMMMINNNYNNNNNIQRGSSNTPESIEAQPSKLEMLKHKTSRGPPGGAGGGWRPPRLRVGPLCRWLWVRRRAAGGPAGS